jgi:hypothetical protein
MYRLDRLLGPAVVVSDNVLVGKSRKDLNFFVGDLPTIFVAQLDLF